VFRREDDFIKAALNHVMMHVAVELNNEEPIIIWQRTEQHLGLVLYYNRCQFASSEGFKRLNQICPF
jgi:hypothetical protein